MYDEMKELTEGFKAEFGEMTVKQLWVLTRLAKRVRLRGRNNSAFNNMMNGVFGSYARFKEVTKMKADGTKYPGLQITTLKQPKGDEEVEKTLGAEQA